MNRVICYSITTALRRTSIWQFPITTKSRGYCLNSNLVLRGCLILFRPIVMLCCSCSLYLVISQPQSGPIAQLIPVVERKGGQVFYRRHSCKPCRGSARCCQVRRRIRCRRAGTRRGCPRAGRRAACAGDRTAASP